MLIYFIAFDVHIAPVHLGETKVALHNSRRKQTIAELSLINKIFSGGR